MSFDLVNALQANLLSPPILFFVLGCVAALVRSDLRFPEPLYIGLTIYLLTAIGLKGGSAIASAGLGAVWFPALVAALLSGMIPLWVYPLLRWAGKLRAVDAAAVAGHYGSVSAVTYIAATNFLREIQEPYEPFAAAFLAVMESPAIIVSVLLGKIGLRREGLGHNTSFGATLHEAALGRSVLLLVGGLVIGYLAGPRLEPTAGFFVTPFQGVLALFLLEMGTVAARRFGDLRRVGLFLLAFGIVMPLVNGMIGLMVGKVLGLTLGGATLFAVLCASASYIAAPAAMRLSLPEANPTLYLTSALAVTFPFNITLGIPLYFAAGRWLFGGVT